MVHLVIDGDLLAFKATAVNEDRSVIATNTETEEVREYKNRAELKQEVGGDAYKQWIFKDVQSPKNFKFSCNTADELVGKWVAFAKADSYEIVVSGRDNFRDNIPLPTRYKSNRDNTIKPLHVRKMKEWLVKERGAYSVDGVEGDDVLAWRAYEGFKAGEKVVQVTIDKDANGCEGWIMHMDCISPPELIKGFGKLYIVTKTKNGREEKSLKGYGKIWMLAQSVLGDTVDGYKPCELANTRWGEMACYDLLKDCKTYKEAIEAIYGQYKKWYPSPVTYTAWDKNEYTKSALEIWQMYFDCARMRRAIDDEVQLLDVFKSLGVEV